MQAPTHVPAWQKVVEPLHTSPQVPQFCGSLASDRQMPSQSWVPAGQVHEPSTQVVPSEQAWPHDPQLAGSVLVSTQSAPHAVVPGAAHEHLPPAQVCSAEHAVPQLPQWVRSVWVSTQAVPQLVRPTAHAASQVPPMQASPVAHA